MSPRKKIPTKIELEQLQKLYKTDEKIGERLGGVPAYLVAYWRRKKNVPKFSMPKFSEREIRNLWERFGDDDKCGLELSISKAAYYNWRRRYGIKEKPAFLKLEQLELNFPGLKTKTGKPSLYGERSITQKILAQLSNKETVNVGETVEIEPDLVVSRVHNHEIINQFLKLSSDYVWNPNKIAISTQPIDINSTDKLAEENKLVREFSRRQNIKNFFDMNSGNCHQLVVESGLIKPGQLGLGTDKNVVSYGCLSSFASLITPSEMATIWSKGKYELDVPPSIRIDINGRRLRSVSSRDIALSIIKQLSKEDVVGKVLEYYGSVVSRMSISDRFTLTNQAAAAGAKGALCHFDSATRRYLSGRTNENYMPIIADKDAVYNGMYQINIDQLTPQIAGPNGSSDVKAVAELDGLPVQQIIIGSCASGRFEDLRIGAEILKGNKVSADCRLIIIPGSLAVYLDALKKGLIRVYIEAGAMILNPGYPVEMNRIIKSLASGERCLATINNIFKQAHETENKKEVYICSPATAAASAINAAVTDPTRYMG